MARYSKGYSAGYKTGKTIRRGARAAPRVANTPSGAIRNAKASDQGLIVTSAVVTFGLGFLNSHLVKRKTPRLRLFIGIAILYVGLAVLAEFNSKLARNFAILIMLSAMLGEGGGVINWLQGRGTHDKIGVTTTGTPNIPVAAIPPQFRNPLSFDPLQKEPAFAQTPAKQGVTQVGSSVRSNIVIPVGSIGFLNIP